MKEEDHESVNDVESNLENVVQAAEGNEDAGFGFE